MRWLLAGHQDSGTVEERWAEDPVSCQAVATGVSFDAVTVSDLFGRALHSRLDWSPYSYPTAWLPGSMTFLLRAGCTWETPGVPAALEVRNAGAKVLLPHPDDEGAWLVRPVGGALPGFIPLLSVARHVLWRAHWEGEVE